MIVIGALMAFAGAVWTLQGFNLLAGSPMSGVTLWAVVGPIVTVVGLAVVIAGARARRRRTPI
jgi:hypothetical protein